MKDPVFSQEKVVGRLDTEKGMFAEVSYKVRATIPGPNQYDYEEIAAKVVQNEGSAEMSGEEMVKSAMTLCRSNTMAAKVAAAKRAQSEVVK